MATADSVKNKIQGLINTANATTGKADTDLTSAVGALIAGFGQGGSGGGGASGLYAAKITPAEDVSTITVEHNLGTTDLLLAAVWAETFGDFVPSSNQSVGNLWVKTDIPTRVTSSENRENYEAYWSYSTSTGNINSAGMKNASGYIRNPTEKDTFNIKAGSSSSARFYGGVTYTVIVIAASVFK